MLNYCNWGYWFIVTDDNGFMVFKMLCNGTEDADIIGLSHAVEMELGMQILCLLEHWFIGC